MSPQPRDLSKCSRRRDKFRRPATRRTAVCSVLCRAPINRSALVRSCRLTGRARSFGVLIARGFSRCGLNDRTSGGSHPVHTSGVVPKVEAAATRTSGTSRESQHLAVRIHTRREFPTLLAMALEADNDDELAGTVRN